MKNHNIDWLVSSLHHSKALIKYEIKQLESRLKFYLTGGNERTPPVEEVVALCTSLIRCYDQYLKMMDSKYRPIMPDEAGELSFKTWFDCYAQIESLQSLGLYSITIVEELTKIQALHRQYQQLKLLISRGDVASRQKVEDVAWFHAIKPLIQASAPNDWLKAIVLFANQQSGINVNDCLVHLSQLDNQQLLHLANAFRHEEYLHIISAIFFYKLYPQKLFNHSLHPEKLVSVKNRLSLLYDFIEILHQTLVQTITQRGLPKIQDYLFHSEDLPQGIEIEIGDDCRDLILSAIKSWNISIAITEAHPSMNQLHEIFCAYKFWFNPARLIDAVMILEQKFIKHHGQVNSKDDFFHQMRSLYRQLTTTECLDLYGYFANKDSNYLMRTLLVVKRGELLSWLPALNSAELDAINRVYGSLACVMSALRDELATRHISTAPYKHDLHELTEKKLTPGRRNRNAVIRIITLYTKKTPRPNTNLEELFKTVES
ncbi:hypothetical protein [Legionella oakridgensis]|uniref:Uncharacterized protein n=2 Tax=Legionella oakridgensis TaxID=29423 RepID=W0BBG9_9GAMM|nr:hypothetical protein [Legionella oakridgensis]AHE66046.1 hypothetical protein Loa_00469 [Legionella oakridgensis ATCC 33761 = DSM 21215]ETO94196.1 hypothetical protein LOR_22c01910 [Legionella oakridgensis RV-2-2007]KTD43549.1 hypothetical protein Loak_0525 [Legionella oakridgensis]STY15968.1 Uncharacterised protein [Legionella longbeachae]